MQGVPEPRRDGPQRRLPRLVIRWVPAALAAGALVLLLLAPAVDGPFLLIGWLLALAGYRWVSAAMPDRAGRMAAGGVFLSICVIAAFEGGWFLIPAAIAYLIRDARATPRPTSELTVPGVDGSRGGSPRGPFGFARRWGRLETQYMGRDNDERASARLGSFVVPLGDRGGLGILSPGPLTSGSARPEPREPWTLSSVGAPASQPTDKAGTKVEGGPDHP